MKRQNLRTVSLIVVTFTYLLIGAAIFGYLESEHEFKQREYLELIEQIIKRKYNISEDDFTVLTTTVIKSVPHKAGIQWKFPGAFYFATTVVTTIGYGHSTPSTVLGRSFCMVYALIGIPLGLVMFQSIGERLNTFVGSALRYAKRCFNSRNPEVTQTNLVMVVSVLSTILMTSMAAVFAKYERWDYFDALYYCFITLTTIGFGDYVALQKESALQSKPEYVALSLIFILFGLSVVSSAVNLLVLKFLTLNTEDERRDQEERFTAALNPIQLEGDVITSSAGKLEYARTKRPALTMSQAMARSSIRRDEKAAAAVAAQSAATAALHQQSTLAAQADQDQMSDARRQLEEASSGCSSTNHESEPGFADVCAYGHSSADAPATTRRRQVQCSNLSPPTGHWQPPYILPLPPVSCRHKRRTLDDNNDESVDHDDHECDTEDDDNDDDDAHEADAHDGRQYRGGCGCFHQDNQRAGGSQVARQLSRHGQLGGKDACTYQRRGQCVDGQGPGPPSAARTVSKISNGQELTSSPFSVPPDNSLSEVDSCAHHHQQQHDEFAFRLPDPSTLTPTGGQQQPRESQQLQQPRAVIPFDIIPPTSPAARSAHTRPPDDGPPELAIVPPASAIRQTAGQQQVFTFDETDTMRPRGLIRRGRGSKMTDSNSGSNDAERQQQNGTRSEWQSKHCQRHHSCTTHAATLNQEQHHHHNQARQHRPRRRQQNGPSWSTMSFQGVNKPPAAYWPSSSRTNPFCCHNDASSQANANLCDLLTASNQVAANQSSCPYSWVSLASISVPPTRTIERWANSTRRLLYATAHSSRPAPPPFQASCLLLNPEKLHQLPGPLAVDRRPADTRFHHRSCDKQPSRLCRQPPPPPQPPLPLGTRGPMLSSSSSSSSSSLSSFSKTFQSSPAVHEMSQREDCGTLATNSNTALIVALERERSLTDDEQESQHATKPDSKSLMCLQTSSTACKRGSPTSAKIMSTSTDTAARPPVDQRQASQNKFTGGSAKMLCRCGDSEEDLGDAAGRNSKANSNAMDLSAAKPRRKSKSGPHKQVAKLVCKCCCQHAECIQYALESKEKDQPNATSGQENNNGPGRVTPGQANVETATATSEATQGTPGVAGAARQANMTTGLPEVGTLSGVVSDDRPVGSGYGEIPTTGNGAEQQELH